ncbi:MAG: hypothetical protein RL701_3865 [Pseudomonadota bacterium]|jgi:hypothetical protein
MRQIRIDAIGQQLVDLLREKTPADEDIGIVDANGTLIGAVITPAAYKFFLQKVEEAEDLADQQSVEEFHHEKGDNNE